VARSESVVESVSCLVTVMYFEIVSVKVCVSVMLLANVATLLV